ncbi:MAG: hypothetical protein J6B05_00010 [Clostridia bacterium]|nr:hypothetical protein [Clostridia bacterium]MBO5334417.1 hypothetical protein [Clostridia bacterium]
MMRIEPQLASRLRILFQSACAQVPVDKQPIFQTLIEQLQRNECDPVLLTQAQAVLTARNRRDCPTIKKEEFFNPTQEDAEDDSLKRAQDAWLQELIQWMNVLLHQKQNNIF